MRFIACSVKKADGVIIQGDSVRTFSARLYRNLWEHVIKTGLKMKCGYNDGALLISSWHLYQPTDVIL